MKFGEEEGQIRGCWLERVVVWWWSMISKICDELGVEDKSSIRRILRGLNGFPPDSLCCFIQTDENIFLSPALSLTSLMDLHGNERRDFVKCRTLTCVCFTCCLYFELS